MAGSPMIVDKGQGEHHRALEVAGRYLAARARTEAQVRARLEAGGFDPEAVAAAVGRLKELGLVNDRSFAVEWIAERAAKGRAPSLLASELAARGIDGHIVEAAMQETAPDEEAQAKALAAELVPRLARLPIEVQTRRLFAALARRGFSEEAAEAAVKGVLPPEGWD